MARRLACLISVAVYLVSTAAAQEQKTEILPGASLYVVEDDVPAQQVYPFKGLDLVLYRGCLVKVLEVDGDRLRVELPSILIPETTWIPANVVATEKPTSAADDPRDQPHDQDRNLSADDVYGTWFAVAMEYQGCQYSLRKDGEEFPTGFYMRVAKDGITMWSDSNGMFPARSGIWIDPKQSPKQLDIVDSEGEKTNVQKGIYTIENGRLIWVCYPWGTDCRAKTQEKPRPKGFRTQPGDGRWRFTFERVTDPILSIPPDERSGQKPSQ